MQTLGGRIGSECLAGLNRNQWPDGAGMRNFTNGGVVVSSGPKTAAF
jgi:hypothetical protein